MNREIIKVIFILSIPILLIQIPMRVYVTEPYPAILLPSGASIIKDNGAITFDRWQLIVRSADDRQYEVNLHELLRSIPAWYRTHVIQRHFGLPTKNSGATTVSRTDEEGRIWIKKKLQEIIGPGFYTSLRIVRYQSTKPTNGSIPPQDKVLGVVEIPLL